MSTSTRPPKSKWESQQTEAFIAKTTERHDVRTWSVGISSPIRVDHTRGASKRGRNNFVIEPTVIDWHHAPVIKGAERASRNSLKRDQRSTPGQFALHTLSSRSEWNFAVDHISNSLRTRGSPPRTTPTHRRSALRRDFEYKLPRDRTDALREILTAIPSATATCLDRVFTGVSLQQRSRFMDREAKWCREFHGSGFGVRPFPFAADRGPLD